MSSLVRSAENYLMDHTSLRRCTNQWFIFFQVCLNDTFRRITAALANLEPSITLVEAQVPPPPFSHTICEDDFCAAYEQGASPYQLCLKIPPPITRIWPRLCSIGSNFHSASQICHGGGRKAQKTPEKGHKKHTKKTRKGRGKNRSPTEKKPGK